MGDLAYGMARMGPSGILTMSEQVYEEQGWAHLCVM